MVEQDARIQIFALFVFTAYNIGEFAIVAIPVIGGSCAW